MRETRRSPRVATRSSSPVTSMTRPGALPGRHGHYSAIAGGATGARRSVIVYVAAVVALAAAVVLFAGITGRAIPTISYSAVLPSGWAGGDAGRGSPRIEDACVEALHRLPHDAQLRFERENSTIAFIGDSSALRSFRDAVAAWLSCVKLVRSAAGVSGFASDASRGGGFTMALMGHGAKRLGGGDFRAKDVLNALADVPERVSEAASTILVSYERPAVAAGIIASSLPPLSMSIVFVRALFASEVAGALQRATSLEEVPASARHHVFAVLSFGAWDLLRPTREVHGFDWGASAATDAENGAPKLLHFVDENVDKVAQGLAALAPRLARVVVRGVVRPNCTAARFGSTGRNEVRIGPRVTASFCREFIVGTSSAGGTGLHIQVDQRLRGLVDGATTLGIPAVFINNTQLVADGTCGVGDGVHFDKAPLCRRTASRQLWSAMLSD